MDSEPQIKSLIFDLRLTEYEDAKLGDMEGLIFMDKCQHTSGLCSSNPPCSVVNDTSFVYAHEDFSTQVHGRQSRLCSNVGSLCQSQNFVSKGKCVCAQQSIALPHNVKHFTQPFFSVLIRMESVGPSGSSTSPACTLAITSCRYFSDPGACPRSVALGHLESVTKLLSPKWYVLGSTSRGHYITIRATTGT